MPAYELTKTKEDIASAMEAVSAAGTALTAILASLLAEVEHHEAALAADQKAAETALAEREAAMAAEHRAAEAAIAEREASLAAEKKASQAELAMRQAELDEQVAAIAQQTAMADDAVSRALNRVRLNVGGQTFETSKPTLLAEPGSMFHALVSSGAFLPDEQKGDFFIDRDPKFFGSLLNYFRDNRRDGTLNIEEDSLSIVDKNLLRSDIEYYQIDSLIDLFQPDDPPELVFVGYASWSQRNQPHPEQDRLMEAAAEEAFPGSRPATWKEYTDKLIKHLPPENDSGRPITFLDISDRQSTHGKRGICNHAPLDGTGSGSFHNGDRCIICVRFVATKRVRWA